MFINIDDFKRHSLLKRIMTLIQYYFNGLIFGDKLMFQSLPRVLTLCFNTGYYVERLGLENLNKIKKFFHKILIYLEKIPVHTFATSVSQLVSQCLKQDKWTKKLMEVIMVKIYEAYPTFVVWQVAIFLLPNKMEQTNRREAAKRVCNILKKKNGIVLKEAQELMKDLDAFTAIKISEEKSILERCWKIFIMRYKDLQLIVPIRKFLKPNTPIEMDLRRDWNTFPHNVTIQKFIGIPKIIFSLAQPKRITCRGTDGENYMFLLKQEKTGDMRKEGRVMDICELINRLIVTCPEGKGKDLSLKTFMVVTWREKAGINL